MNVFFPKESKVLKSAAPNLMMTNDSDSKDKTKNEWPNPLSCFFFYNHKSYSTNKVHHHQRIRVGDDHNFQILV